FIGYVISQCLGALAGAIVLMALIGKEYGLGTNGLYNGSIGKSLLIEIILTCIFVLAILGVTSKAENGKVAGLVIGASLTLVHLIGIHFTGTSVNPARSLGPALLMGGDALSCVWVFIVAPLIGGALAALIWRGIRTEE
ncbi:MAG: aquaporin, partial [Firmicutes bacterium]|nr:aquaporin [Bacillota bacterium]